MSSWPAPRVLDAVAAGGSSLFADTELGPVLFDSSSWIAASLGCISIDYLLSDKLLGSRVMDPSHLGVLLNGDYLQPSQFMNPSATSQWSEGGQVSISMIRDHIGNGASLVFHNAHHWQRALRGLCETIEDSGGRQAGATLFYTPSSQRGAAPHRDSMDIFAFQISGSKEWLVEPVTSTTVIKNTPVEENDFARTQPRKVCLSSGDGLYMPAGTAHTARSRGRASAHASVWFKPNSAEARL